MLMKTTVTSSPSLAGTSGITLDSLRVSYHGNVVLKPLSLTIEPGEVLALIGPSGSGKTTVLRAIAGFVQPAGGRILIGDTDVTQLPPYKRGLAMVVQNYALFPHMKVEDNVASSLGASPWYRLRHVTLPLMTPWMISALALSLSLSMGELGATVMIYPPGWTTLPVTIFSLTDRGNIADGSALTIVLVGVTLLLMMKLERIARRLSQR